ncbi:ATP-dependent metalloprotease [Acrasis kona]|uniref:ATP-dependent metalloprotease n=1 Tax=Acrasis kona TaxID=1008807 RepID=A0AAW2YM22_9EUKA
MLRASTKRCSTSALLRYKVPHTSNDYSTASFQISNIKDLFSAGNHQEVVRSYASLNPPSQQKVQEQYIKSLQAIAQTHYPPRPQYYPQQYPQTMNYPQHQPYPQPYPQIINYPKQQQQMNYQQPYTQAIVPPVQPTNTSMLIELDRQIQQFKKKVKVWESTSGTLRAVCIIFATLYVIYSAQNVLGKLSFVSKEINTEAVKSDKRLSDVVGIDPCLKEVGEYIDMLKNPSMYEQYGVKPPKGLLLVGEPGTGKTLLAKAIAGECGFHFIATEGAAMDEKYVGVGAKRIRDLFKAAREKSPCIIFIDEIDALAGRRSDQDGSHHRAAINALLAEMDGFKDNGRVLVIAATNKRDDLDPALLRPGRVDREITVPLPDSKGREKILNYYLKDKSHQNIDMNLWASKMMGMTGADIENVVNDSAMNAARSKRDYIIDVDMDSAIDRRRMGMLQDIYVSPEDKRRTAYHEVGHAFTLISGICKKHDLHKVTILPRGSSLGHTAFVPKDDSPSYTKQFYMDKLHTALGGLVAEEIFFGELNLSTGPSDDLRNVTKTARDMVMKFGMDDELGYHSYNKDDIGEETKAMVDRIVTKLVKERYDHVKDLLLKNKDLVVNLAEELIKYETLDKNDIDTFLKEGRINRTPEKN